MGVWNNQTALFGHSGASVSGCLTNMDDASHASIDTDLGDRDGRSVERWYVWSDCRCEYGSKVLSKGDLDGRRMKKVRCLQVAELPRGYRCWTQLPAGKWLIETKLPRGNWGQPIDNISWTGRVGP